jgi:hypothetical protein
MSPGGGPNSTTQIKGTITVILQDAKTGEVKHRETVDNYVTYDGDIYYAELGAQKTQTNDFGGATGRMVMNDSSGTSPDRGADWGELGAVVGSGNPKAFDTFYPHVNDSDSDNTGVNLTSTVTYRTSYTTGEANGDIAEVAIHLTGASGTDPILMQATFSEFTKTASDTLKVFVNHKMTGV